MATEQHEVIVIGSGFGGASAAARLVDAGVKVTLLERGPWRRTAAVVRNSSVKTAPLPSGRHFLSHALRRFSTRSRSINFNKSGFFDIHCQSNFTAICSSNVGGGSHVYAALNTLPAAADFWSGHHSQISDEVLSPHYDWIFSCMGSQRVAEAGVEIPNYLTTYPGRPDWMVTEGVEQPRMGINFGTGRYANNGFFGSADNNKVTLDARLLLPRLNKGLTVHDQHEVLDLARDQHGFTLQVKDHGRGQLRTMHARFVLLAAGAINSLKLLLACRERGSLNGMPALGQGIGGNGDVIALWGMRKPKDDFTQGLPCHGSFAIADYQDAPLLTCAGLNGMPGMMHRLLRNKMLIISMGVDAANGVASWKRGNLHIDYNRQDSPVFEKIYTALDEISRRSDNKVRFFRNHPITAHMFGGVRLGESHDNSVVNHRGEVHDIPGLYICDGSVLPAAPGSPPSMTIAAWSSAVASQFVADKGHTAPVTAMAIES